MKHTTIVQDNAIRHSDLPVNPDGALKYLRSKGATRSFKWLCPLPILYHNIVMWKPNR